MRKNEMVEELDPKITDKPPARCAECDRVMDHYNIYLSPTNIEKVVCWQCMNRDEKGFFAKRDFNRRSRRGVIPR